MTKQSNQNSFKTFVFYLLVRNLEQHLRQVHIVESNECIVQVPHRAHTVKCRGCFQKRGFHLQQQHAPMSQNITFYIFLKEKNKRNRK